MYFCFPLKPINKKRHPRVNPAFANQSSMLYSYGCAPSQKCMILILAPGGNWPRHPWWSEKVLWVWLAGPVSALAMYVLCVLGLHSVFILLSSCLCPSGFCAFSQSQVLLAYAGDIKVGIYRTDSTPFLQIKQSHRPPKSQRSFGLVPSRRTGLVLDQHMGVGQKVP